MLRFDQPLWLLALALLPALLWLRARSRRDALPVPEVPTTPLPSSLAAHTAWLPAACGLTAAAFAIVGLAGPRWIEHRTTRLREGVDLVLALDASDTMGALDFRLSGRAVTRLDAVKALARDFVSRRRGDRVGAVVFGTYARTAVPRTADLGAVTRALEDVALGSLGDATALGDALALAVKRLRGGGPSRAVILLTDGRSNAGALSPTEAGALAATLGVRVYPVAIGGDAPVPVPVEDPVEGRKLVWRRLPVDEATLRGLARDTDGRFFRVAGLEGLREVYQTIDRLETAPYRVRGWEERRELYPWAVAAAAAFVGFTALARATRWGVTP